MPFPEVTRMQARQLFVALAQEPDCNFAALCRQFTISRPTGYKWLALAEQGQLLAERSSRPHTSPRQTSDAMEQTVLKARDRHPAWGARKLARWLEGQGVDGLPRPSTITAILQRQGRLPVAAERVRPFQRFAAEAANDLWQIDFKGPVALARGQLHPLTVLDDHSRYLIGLTACLEQTDAVVRTALTAHFREVGLPKRILTDNGPPWGSTHPTQSWTALNFWWIRLGIAVSHGRPYHPQTQGKVERVHRTMARELLTTQTWFDQPVAQAACDRWRVLYNWERPHEVLELEVPASRYTTSPRPFPEPLAPIVYEPDDRVLKVHGKGQITVAGRSLFLTHALVREPVALRPTEIDGVEAVYYCDHQLGVLDRRGPKEDWTIERTDGRCVNHVPIHL